MADNVAVTPGTGKTIGTDEIIDATLGTVQIQYVKLMDGTLDGQTKSRILGANTAPVSTDPALVVSLSPNGLNVNGIQAATGSAPVVIANNQPTLAVAPDTTQIMNGVTGTALTPSKAKISITTNTTTTLVALVSSKKIRVLSLYFITTAANNINLQSHTTTSNNDGVGGYAANGGIVLPFNPLGWFDTTSGEALDMVTSAATQVSGQLTYIAV